MPIRGLLLACVAVLALAVAGPAAAQVSTIPQDGSGLSTEPPPGIGDGDDGGDTGSDDDGGGGDGGSADDGDERAGSSSGERSSDDDDAARSRESTLPRTGEDVPIMLLAGLSLLLVGVGLRLRTVDADLY